MWIPHSFVLSGHYYKKMIGASQTERETCRKPATSGFCFLAADWWFVEDGVRRFIGLETFSKNFKP
jgi:hypothetical protein